MVSYPILFNHQSLSFDMPKRWSFVPTDEARVDALQKELPIARVLCRLLVQRGIATKDDAEVFFRPKLEHLHNPFLLCDMDKAVRRLEKAIIRKEKILIYGDYDVDGTTAVALMMSFLRRYHTPLDFYIPDRYKEGYGISHEGVEYAHQHGFGLVIALDCGITAHEPLTAAQKLGIDFIICDHHLPTDTLPPAVAILNPKRACNVYPYKELSGCAIGFKLIQAFAMHNDIPFAEVESLLDLVAVSLACDFVDLTGENRVLAHYGLQRFNEQPRTGLSALKNLLHRTENNAIYTIRDLVFGVGPVINAAGRIEHASEAVKLLLAEDEAMATLYAQNLLTKNQERRDLEADIAREARELLAADSLAAQRKTIVLFREHWHKGVIGIVASKMVEEFHKPTLIFTASDDKIVGSARSVEGFDIHAALEHCSDLFINFGGHTQAAGVTMPAKHFNEFVKRFEEVVAASIPLELQQATVHIDSELELKQIDAKFWNILRQFEPFGPANMRPVFMSKNVHDNGYSKLVKEKHVKLSLRQDDSDTMEGIAYYAAEHFEEIRSRRPFHVLYVVEENTFQGKTSLQINARDMRF